MEAGKEVYFVSDVHLGLQMLDPRGREERFVRFLKELPRDRVGALYLLGDIWDFWFEYRDVVPRCGTRVVAELISLMDAGVEVWFCQGNHDIWTFSFFESLGMRKFTQPYFTEIGGKLFCLGHGDALGGAKLGYRLMIGLFGSRFMQWLFSLLHPWLAYRMASGFSSTNRRSHKPYRFRGEEEALYAFAEKLSSERHVDYFVFGHYHDAVDMVLPTGARLVILKDWIGGGSPHAVFSVSSSELHSQA